MKIDLQSKFKYFPPVIDSKRQMSPSLVPQKSSGNYDEITIASDQESSPEQHFADSLSSRLSLEIRKPVSSKQIQDLQQQIDQGTYQVDVNSLADKIMLY